VPQRTAGLFALMLAMPLLVACEQSVHLSTPVEGFDTQGYLTSKTPYRPLQDFAEYEPAPAGARLLQVQTVIRHGSRALSGPDDDVLSLALWRLAQQSGALTPLGQALGPLLEAMQSVNVTLGYGNISAMGGREQRDLAARLLQRHPAWLEDIVATQRPITVHHSGRDRADQSADAFIEGLLQQQPQLAEQIQPSRATPDTLYFHSAEGSADYRAYRKDDARLRATLDRLAALTETDQAVRVLLEALYTPVFLERLAAGEIVLAAPDDPEETLSSPLDAAQRLYALYGAASNLVEEQALDFGYFLAPQAVAWLAYLDDAETFYERGPAFADEDVSYRGALPLVEAMLSGAAAAAAPDAPAMALRFTHAQALLPLAAFLGIPGSSEPLPEAVLYDYTSSDWRSEQTVPMSANVQWEVFELQDGTLAVRMLHQEAPAQFKSGCQVLAGTQTFYAVSELQRCLL